MGAGRVVYAAKADSGAMSHPDGANSSSMSECANVPYADASAFILRKTANSAMRLFLKAALVWFSRWCSPAFGSLMRGGLSMQGSRGSNKLKVKSGYSSLRYALYGKYGK